MPLHQKTVTHRPQTKILEFFVAILAGLKHLKDLSRSAHPIDRDEAVAKAWRQSCWADSSGVSRTLSELTREEAEQVANALDRMTQPIVAEEVMKALQLAGRLTYDGDLTDRPVSSRSTTCPNVAYGHMGNALRLGYQAAMVSLHSPTDGRFWLSVVFHPGNTTSCTQAEAMVLAAEAKTGLRPLRRTDLLRSRESKNRPRLRRTHGPGSVGRNRVACSSSRTTASLLVGPFGSKGNGLYHCLCQKVHVSAIYSSLASGCTKATLGVPPSDNAGEAQSFVVLAA